MPIPVQTPESSFAPNGASTVFAFEFTILSADDLKVQIDGSIVTNYNITGVGSRTGGTVVFTSAPTGTVGLIYREISLEREADYQENGDLTAASLDDDFDRAWCAIQDQAFLFSRTIRAPRGEALAELPSASARASKYLAFDVNGTRVLVDAPSASDASALTLALAGAAGAGLIGLDQSLNYVVGTLGWFCKDSAINVRMPLVGISDGAVGDSTMGTTSGTDDTEAFQGAITWATAQNKRVYVPPTASGKGYLITDTLLGPNHTMISGEHCHMGFRSGTCINFRPSSLKSFFQPTGLPAALKDGYLIENLYIEGNSTSAAGNANIGLNIDNIIKSTFRNCRIQGFRTGIRCYATNSNQFFGMHPTSNYVQSVLYDGGISTTDNWYGGYISNAPILINTNGSNLHIRFWGVTLEGAGWPEDSSDTTQAIGVNIVKETEHFEFHGCYGEDAPLTDNATNAMFMVGRDGSTLSSTINLRIIGGVWKGRNAGGRGAFLKTYGIDGVYVGAGAHIQQYTTAIDNSDAATLTDQIILGMITCTSVGTIVADDTKVTGEFAVGVVNSSARCRQTSRTASDSYGSPGGACTGAITTSSGWGLAREGNTVTLKLQATTGTASASPSFTFADVIPAKYRPSASQAFSCPIVNNGANQATPGVIVIDYLTGAITVYKDGSQTSNFTAAANAGLGYGTSVSWTA